MRKLIQIVDCPDSASAAGCIFGLCDDGTLWAFSYGKWDLVSSEIPQYQIEKREFCEAEE